MVLVLKRLRLSAAYRLTLALVVAPALARQPRSDYRNFEKAVSNELKETNTPGAAVAIVRGDHIIYPKGFGISNVETGAPVTPDMLFRVARGNYSGKAVLPLPAPYAGTG